VGCNEQLDLLKAIAACIPPKTNRKVQYLDDKRLYASAPQDRETVRQDQGLAARCNPLRPMRPHLHVRHPIAATVCYWLRSMSPGPSLFLSQTAACSGHGHRLSRPQIADLEIGLA